MCTNIHYILAILMLIYFEPFPASCKVVRSTLHVQQEQVSKSEMAYPIYLSMIELLLLASKGALFDLCIVSVFYYILVYHLAIYSPIADT